MMNKTFLSFFHEGRSLSLSSVHLPSLQRMEILPFPPLKERSPFLYKGFPGKENNHSSPFFLPREASEARSAAAMFCFFPFLPEQDAFPPFPPTFQRIWKNDFPHPCGSSPFPSFFDWHHHCSLFLIRSSVDSVGLFPLFLSGCAQIPSFF